MAGKTKTRVIYRNKKKTRRRKNRFTLPLAVMAPTAYLGMNTITNFQKIGANAALAVLTNQLTGYDPRTNKWAFSNMTHGLLPLLVGAFAHKAAGRLGINRMLSSAGIPIIRI